MSEDSEKIKIIGLPKGVFLYPTAIVAIIIGILELFLTDPNTRNVMGVIFLAIFTLNLFILFFEFSRGHLLGLTFGIIALVFAYLYFKTAFGFNIPTPSGDTTLSNFDASPYFYLFVGGIILLMILISIIKNSYFSYYEITPNRVVHSSGIFDDEHSFPTARMSIEKQTNDVFEYLLLRSGRLILTSGDGKKSIVIDNVPNIKKVIERIDNLLSYVKVKDEAHEE